jgi:hypothetical protein|nr:hypothetical protein [Kofleriaceae bacterium]
MALNRRALITQGAIAAAAIAIAWAFAATVLAHTPRMGLPIDDGYIYLTYAKQFGRGQPFTYYPGGGYSAGATSILWPMLLAPFWTLGARGHALVWVSFGLCTALYAATAIGAYRVARRGGDEITGVLAAALVLSVSAFAWCALSGMEVALASALLVATVLLLLEPRGDRPRTRLLLCLAALALARPEATVLVVAIIAVSAWPLRRTPRRALLWLAPLAPLAAWLAANRALAGHWFPNTGVSKSHFYLPGFDWTYWIGAVHHQITHALWGLFAADLNPFGPTRLVGVLWLVGAWRAWRWGRANDRRLAMAVLVAGPFVQMVAVFATSGAVWWFQGYRYLAPGFPLIAIVAAWGLAPIAALPRWASRAVAIAAALAIAAFAIKPMRDDILSYAQGATDTNTQVVQIGEWIAAHRPDARVMFHDAGAIAYYGDTEVTDMLGLVTNHQAEVALNGPGSRFEQLESLPPEQRPTLFAYYPTWLGVPDFYGEPLLHTMVRGQFSPGDRQRLTGGADMEVFEASWDHVGTAERPLVPQPGWTMVDRVDVADLDSERAHAWRGALGRRRLADPSARWSFVERELGPSGLAIDGGRTIRGGRESFTLAVTPGKPVRLILRTGGARGIPLHDVPPAPVQLAIRDASDGRELAHATLAPADGVFVEVPFELPAPATSALAIETDASDAYRAFHWFAMQPN